MKEISRFCQKLSRMQLILIMLIHAIAPTGTFLFLDFLNMRPERGTWEYWTYILAGVIAGVFILVIDLTLVLLPLEKLKGLMKYWSDQGEMDRVQTDLKETEIGSIFAELVVNHQEQVSREYQMAVLKKQAELTALQSQINPHFLYNTLDSIRGLALLNDVPQIAEMTEALSKLFRCMIANEGQMITLKDELQSVENYMLIQQFRFDGRIAYRANLEQESMLGYYVPNLIIQPIVENAVIHGLENKEDGGVVSVSGYATWERLVIMVEDNGIGITQDKLDELNEELKNSKNARPLREGKERHRGIALLNISQRIRLHFGNDYGLYIMSTPNVSTTVEITLPLILSPLGEIK